MPCTSWESIWLRVTGIENRQDRSVGLSQNPEVGRLGLLPQIPRDPPGGSIIPSLPFLGLPIDAPVPAITTAFPALGRRKGQKRGAKGTHRLSSRKTPEIALQPFSLYVIA